MRKVKSIDELYAEVRKEGCDFVVTTDVALATALDRRVDFPRLGHFAMTPEQIARKMAFEILGEPVLDDINLVRRISENTGYGLRFVHGEVENIRQIRRYTPRVDEYIGHSRASKNILKEYQQLPTMEKAMSSFDGDVKKRFFSRFNKVAVIGLADISDDDDPGIFNDLEKNFYPEPHYEADRFQEQGDYTIDRIYELGNDRQLATNVVDLIEGDPEDYALVLCHDSPITDAVKAALTRKGIPYKDEVSIGDLPEVRSYLEFLELSSDWDLLRISDVSDLFRMLGGTVYDGVKGYLLSKAESGWMDSKAEMINNMMRHVFEYTFGELVDAIYGDSGKHVMSMLDHIGFKDSRISRVGIRDVRYFATCLEGWMPEDYVQDRMKGVLIADCKNSGFIDKPVIFFIGMGQDWNFSLVGKRYMDAEDESYRDRKRLEIMLQQGLVRGYFVNSTKGGKTARPCLTFDDIYGDVMDGFVKMVPEGSLFRGRWADACEPYGLVKTESYEVPTYDFKFSKSTLNSFCECPRFYMLEKLITTASSIEAEFGSMIHEYPEALLTSPEKVGENRSEIIDRMCKSYAGLSFSEKYGIDSDRIILQVHNIESFLDALGAEVPLDLKASPRRPNSILEWLGVEERTSMCEEDRGRDDLHIHGKFDLLYDGVIIDYKTGRLKKADDVCDGFSLNKKPDYVELQPLMYLALGESIPQHPDEFRLFYPQGNDLDSLTEGFDIMENTVSVKRYHGSWQQIAAEVLEREYTTDVLQPSVDECLRCYKELYRMKKSGNQPMDWKKGDDVLGRTINPYFNAKRDVYRKIRKWVEWGAVVEGKTAYVPDELMESFKDLLEVCFSEMNEFSSSDFPARPRLGCKDCKLRMFCTKEIDDQKEEVE